MKLLGRNAAPPSPSNVFISSSSTAANRGVSCSTSWTWRYHNEDYHCILLSKLDEDGDKRGSWSLIDLPCQHELLKERCIRPGFCFLRNMFGRHYFSH